MNAQTEIQPLSQSSAFSALMLELAKALKLVAPVTMTADAQMVWLQAAVDALEGIRADEVAAVSAELRRSVTRHNQIVPEIARLVSERRSRASRRGPENLPSSLEFAIDREARNRRGRATSQAEVDDAWEWERDARGNAGLHVDPRPKPLNAAEIAALRPSMVKMGLKCGVLAYRAGQLVDTAA